MSRKKLTKLVVNERIKDRGIELIGEYINNGSPSLFRCPNNHTWKTRPSSVMQGKGCPHPDCNNRFTLTKEVVNKRIKDRGFELIGECINSRTKSLFRCSNNHEWNAKMSNVLQKTGCPSCSNSAPLTKEVVNERIKDRGIELIGEYYGALLFSLFRCSNNHEWKTRPSSVMQGIGCPHCSNASSLTKEVVNKRIKDRGFELIGEYINSRTKSLFRCSNNHEWNAKMGSVLQGSGCTLCSYSGGFKPNKAGHGYLLDFGYFIKFGISNVLPRRLTDHKRNNGNFTIIKTKLFENGQDALNWENNIKKKYGGSYVSKDVLPDGFTETLPMFLKETLLITLDF